MVKEKGKNMAQFIQSDRSCCSTVFIPHFLSRYALSPSGFLQPSGTVPCWMVKGHHAHCCFSFGCDGYEETLHLFVCLCYLWHCLAGVCHPLLIFPPQCFYCHANGLHCIFNLLLMRLPSRWKMRHKKPKQFAHLGICELI